MFSNIVQMVYNLRFMSFYETKFSLNNYLNLNNTKLRGILTFGKVYIQTQFNYFAIQHCKNFYICLIKQKYS